jgi:serine phosphatase RsbU (regulator of sigma subunit)
LGVSGSSPYVEHELHLDGPRVLVMYTDGLIERRNEDLGAAIEALVRRVAGSPDPYRPDRLCHDLVESVAGDDLEDDYCVLAVGIDPAGASIPLRPEEPPSAIATAEDAVES